MFGRNYLHTRIRAAEKALAAGRVDDALEAAMRPDVRANPRGEQLAQQLRRPLLAHARLEAEGGNYARALDRLDQLAALGFADPESKALRQRVQRELVSRHQDRAASREAYDRAARKLNEGRLESGRHEIPRVPDPEQRESLQNELDIRMRRSAELLEQAGQALDNGDLASAARVWQEVVSRYGRTTASDQLAARVARRLHDALQDDLRNGQLDRLVARQASVTPLVPFLPELGHLERIVQMCVGAGRQLSSGDWPGLRQTLVQLRSVTGEAAWVDETLDALRNILNEQERLLMSPIGLIAMTNPASQAEALTRGPATIPSPAAAPVMRRPVGSAPWHLMVDGGSSSILLMSGLVRIGRSGSAAESVDVAIPSDLQPHHADILREGDDYFLHAHAPTWVNRQRVTRHLLRDGDRITFSRNAKLTFSRPAARSGSAVLRLSHRCRLAHDVSDVVLFRDTCLVGPQPSCHLRAPSAQNQVVVFHRDGKLLGREAPAGRRGHLGDARPLDENRSADFGDLRITLKRYLL